MSRMAMTWRILLSTFVATMSHQTDVTGATPEVTCGGGCIQSCLDVQKAGGKSGVSSLNVNDTSGTNDTMSVWCDMESGDGGWLVFQRRRDGSVDFYRNWREYENGFGDVTGEFWLGLSKLHKLTKDRPQRLRVDLGEVTGERHFAEYSSFSLEGPDTNYTLHVSGYQLGNAGESLTYHSYNAFTTKDRDNDYWPTGNCAQFAWGAWWFDDCLQSNLNGHYQQDGGKDTSFVTWFGVYHDWRSFTFTEMKIRPA